jgi:mono/diheme cytochrome c family protein
MIQLVKRLGVTGLVLVLLAPPVFVLTVNRITLGQRSRSSSGSRRTYRVADLFVSNCARCHGADGRGDTPLGHTYNTPDFTQADWWRKHSDITSPGHLVSIVSHGKGGMPAFNKKLTRTQIRLLVSYVRKFKPRDSK